MRGLRVSSTFLTSKSYDGWRGLPGKSHASLKSGFHPWNSHLKLHAVSCIHTPSECNYSERREAKAMLVEHQQKTAPACILHKRWEWTLEKGPMASLCVLWHAGRDTHMITHTHICTHIHIHTHTYICTPTLTPTCTHHTHAHTHSYTQMHIVTHTVIQSYH